jgi:hypothetical protein
LAAAAITANPGVGPFPYNLGRGRLSIQQRGIPDATTRIHSRARQRDS